MTDKDHSQTPVPAVPALPDEYKNNPKAIQIYQTLQPMLTCLVESIQANYIGECVSQLEHGLQAAYFSTRRHADDQTFILAALLHDIGHSIANAPPEDFDMDSDDSVDTWMGEFGAARHEYIGAKYLRSLGFSQTLCELVESHVAVKRYKTAVDPDYYSLLSNASQNTLRYQGGPMTVVEYKKFEDNPLFSLKLELREMDEAAKVENLVVPQLDAYLPMMIKHLLEQASH